MLGERGDIRQWPMQCLNQLQTSRCSQSSEEMPKCSNSWKFFYQLNCGGERYIIEHSKAMRTTLIKLNLATENIKSPSGTRLSKEVCGRLCWSPGRAESSSLVQSSIPLPTLCLASGSRRLALLLQYYNTYSHFLPLEHTKSNPSLMLETKSRFGGVRVHPLRP